MCDFLAYKKATSLLLGKLPKLSALVVKVAIFFCLFIRGQKRVRFLCLKHSFILLRINTSGYFKKDFSFFKRQIGHRPRFVVEVDLEPITIIVYIVYIVSILGGAQPQRLTSRVNATRAS